MAIISPYSDAVFTYSNTGRFSGYAMPDVNSGTGFASTWWVYLNNNTPFTIWSYDGGGSYIRILHDGTNWLLSLNGATTVINTVQQGTWITFGYNKNGDNHKVFYNGVQKINITVSITFAFSLLTFTASKGNAVDNFKLVNQSAPSIGALYNEWAVSTSTVPGVVWQSPLRRRGDLTGSGMYQSTNWDAYNNWTTYPDWTTLSFQDDPDVLKGSIMNTWLLPIGGIGSVHFEGLSVPISPSTTVRVDAGWFKVEDRQAIPLNAFIRSIVYFGRQYNTEVVSTTIISIDRWTKYLDENGTLLDDKDSASRDALGTEGANPYNYLGQGGGGSNRPMTMYNIYQWQFGIYWEFVNVLLPGPPTNYPPYPSAHSHVDYPAVLVEWSRPAGGGPGTEPPMDWPPEVPPPIAPPPPDQSGLYFTHHGDESTEGGGDGSGITSLHDNYYDRSVTLPAPGNISKKIPDPTIKTALIGE